MSKTDCCNICFISSRWCVCWFPNTPGTDLHIHLIIFFTSILIYHKIYHKIGIKKTHVNIRSALSFKADNGLFAHWNRNWRNSGHWLLPSSSIKFLATSAATSQTLRRILSVCSFWTDSKICSFNWTCASGGICEIIAYQIYL